MERNVWICIGKAGGNYDAYAPEVPGCVSDGNTIEETKTNMAEALSGHLAAMFESGDSLSGIKGGFPFADAEEAKENGEDEYYFLVKVGLPELVADE
jgi:predicted RNase H-like HicB family nuclease